MGFDELQGQAGVTVERFWPEEALDFEAAVTGALTRLGGVELARRCEAEPGLRASLVQGALSELGLLELDPHAGPLEAAAAARAAHAAGAVVCPWPLVQRLAVPGSLRASWDAVYLADGSVGRLEHLDLAPRSLAADLRSGDLHEVATTGVLEPAPLDPFGSACRLGERVAGDQARAMVAALVVLGAFWAAGVVGHARDLAVGHARDRRQFGHRIGEFGGIQVHLSEIAVAHDSLWELACFTLARFADGEVVAADLLALQYATVDAMRSVFARAHQVLAAIGLCDEHDLTVLNRHAQFLAHRPAGATRLLGLLAEEIELSGFDALYPVTPATAERPLSGTRAR